MRQLNADFYRGHHLARNDMTGENNPFRSILLCLTLYIVYSSFMFDSKDFHLSRIPDTPEAAHGRRCESPERERESSGRAEVLCWELVGNMRHYRGMPALRDSLQSCLESRHWSLGQQGTIAITSVSGMENCKDFSCFRIGLLCNKTHVCTLTPLSVLITISLIMFLIVC